VDLKASVGIGASEQVHDPQLMTVVVTSDKGQAEAGLEQLSRRPGKICWCSVDTEPAVPDWV
jgi:hypothetical protein